MVEADLGEEMTDDDNFTVVAPNGEIVFVTANIGTGTCGVAFPDAERSITIDGRERNKDKLDTFVHEALHVAFPDEDEGEISEGANFIAEILWKAGYRRKCERKC